MAEGKYLLTIAELYRSKLINSQDFENQVQQACERLHSKTIAIDGGIGWGLGFSWRNLPPTEPYLITTAIILHGLGSLAQQHTASAEFTNLLHEGLGGLTQWATKQTVPHTGLPIRLPIFSPGIPEPVLNAAAYALYVLKQYAPDIGVREQASHALSHFGDLRREEIGWEYSPSTRVVDLIHQCYLINALHEDDFAAFEQNLIELVQLFDSVGGYADKCEIIESKHTISSVDIPLLRRAGDLYVNIARKPARLWSLGELLVSISKATSKSINRTAWKRRGHAVTEAILGHYTRHSRETQYPRHSMHAAHGLASYLAVLRDQQREPEVKSIENPTCNTTIAL